ncbi:MAG: hypothetical protein AAGF67_10655, partial [Verrucomicrobiota bacterium]
MKPRKAISTLASLLALLSGAAVALAESDDLLFEVKFTRDGVAFAGKVDTEENALRLAESVKAVRPDLEILNKGLKIDESAEMPRLSDLKSLLAELGISTHEGRLSLYENEVVIGGMTDSRISLTALRIRLEPFLKGKTLINRLCIVSEDDMPKLRIHLSNGETSGPLLNFDEIPTAAESFEPPGLSLANLFPMVLTLSDLSRLTGESTGNPIGAKARPIQAVPLVQVQRIGGETPAATQTVLRAIPAAPQPTEVPLTSVFYTRNSFLLQANQEANLEALIKQLNTPPLAGHPVFLRPVKSNSQGNAFGSYLVEKRSAAAKELFTERGIPAERITLEPVSVSSATDSGEVRVAVRIP